MPGTKIKICGLRRLEDIEYANELKPDYVGFVFAPSKRQVTLPQVAELIKNLDSGIKKVGVFVNQQLETVNMLKTELQLDVLQFHGSEDIDYMKALSGCSIWKTVSIKTGDSQDNRSLYEKQQELNALNGSSIESILLDSEVGGQRGGTGVAFRLSDAIELRITKPLMLAGGLTAYNVEAAVRAIRPFGVDVSSSVETNGVKDYSRMKEFIEKVRSIL